jgi:hypothetical protein
VAEDSFLSSPRLQIAALEIEILLGLLLLSKLARRLTWFAAIGFFTIVAILSLYQALEGQSSCGCFGAVSVDPRATLVFDILILTGLVIFRPVIHLEDSSFPSPPEWVMPLLRTGIGALLLVALAGAAFLAVADDPHRALARLRGETISVDPAMSNVGEGGPGESRSFSISLTNSANHPVRLTGWTGNNCFALSTEELPITLAPGEFRKLRLSLVFPPGAGVRFQRSVTFFTDDEKQPLLTVWFRGRVAAAQLP